MHPLLSSIVAGTESRWTALAKRNDIAPYERHQARRWTRVSDYVPDADAHVGNLHWPKPGSLPSLEPKSDGARPRSARGFLLPVAAVAAAAILSLWASGAFGPSEPRAPTKQAATSRGLVFGLCTEGGLTNCVASGDSFYLAGKTVRIAGIEAPQLYGAACPRELELGRRSAARLQLMLNSGELEMTKAAQDLDRYGLLLRHVAVDGQDVGKAMVHAGLAREIGDTLPGWC